MTREMFMLFAIGYYFLTMIIIVIVLLVISNKTKKKYLAQINELERQKNLVISAGILSELNKVESLINNDDLRKKYELWQKKFNEIKNEDIPKITDLINEVQGYFETKDYANLKASIIKTEMDLNYLQTKSGILLDEIKEIILKSENISKTTENTITNPPIESNVLTPLNTALPNKTKNPLSSLYLLFIVFNTFVFNEDFLLLRDSLP